MKTNVIKQEESICFIAEPEELSELAMSEIRGGKSAPVQVTCSDGIVIVPNDPEN
jgi:hypothetical protein